MLASAVALLQGVEDLYIAERACLKEILSDSGRVGRRWREAFETSFVNIAHRCWWDKEWTRFRPEGGQWQGHPDGRTIEVRFEFGEAGLCLNFSQGKEFGCGVGD